MAEKVKLEISDEIAIKVESMNKWFGSFHVLRDIDLTVNLSLIHISEPTRPY